MKNLLITLIILVGLFLTSCNTGLEPETQIEEYFYTNTEIHNYTNYVILSSNGVDLAGYWRSDYYQTPVTSNVTVDLGITNILSPWEYIVSEFKTLIQCDKLTNMASTYNPKLEVTVYLTSDAEILTFDPIGSDSFIIREDVLYGYIGYTIYDLSWTPLGTIVDTNISNPLTHNEIILRIDSYIESNS
jgi:hypothetical protein